jgi:hypothetical protein
MKLRTRPALAATIGLAIVGLAGWGLSAVQTEAAQPRPRLQC